jgi:hypothetical protein
MKEKLLLTNQRASFAVVSELFQGPERALKQTRNNRERSALIG